MDNLNRRNWFHLIFICFLLLLGGCNNNEEGKETVDKDGNIVSSEEEEKTNEIKEEENSNASFISELEEMQFTDVEERMQLDMGDVPYNGDKYDEAAVLKELETFPDDLTNEEYFSGILSLIGEDYREYYDFFENYDTSMIGVTAEPGSENTSEEKKAEKQVNVSVLLDSSGSMNEQIDGKTKMQIAKEAIETFLEGLPKEANVSLIVYGHEGSGSDADKEQSCTTIEEVYSLNQYKKEEFQQALESFEPAGWTPLGGALTVAQKNLEKQNKEDAVNIIYVVSDGVETCDTNPVEAAKEINQSNMEAIVNIIGFDVDDEGQKQPKKSCQSGKRRVFDCTFKTGTS